MFSSRQVRQDFIDYFVERHGHAHVPSSQVIPHDDPTLLFANAGMNQFKDVLLGTGTRPYCRAVNSQKCIRAGGKHNDLEDVGKDGYHHTFFEMLGNWSFGDYFKHEAIVWAWDLLTRRWGLDKSRLYATVYKGDVSLGVERDEESAELWRMETDIDPSHVLYGADNFWEMGDTGPCGPNSEVHIDLTEDGSGARLIDAGDPRVIELWNLVFIQFNRESDGSLRPLPLRHVDTGMGFERICSVLQHVDSNYDTDVFAPIFGAIQEVTGGCGYGGSFEDQRDTAYRVIADHIRCLVFALSDGAVPSNEGRGYVLRRILRRAVRHGWQTMGIHEPFLFRLVPAVSDAMGDAFGEIRQYLERTINLIKDEEESFGRTLDRGIALFDGAAKRAGDRIGAEDAFKLHDTYGFPLDLTQIMAEERGLTVDEAGFQRLMGQARERARAAADNQAGGGGLIQIVQKESPPATVFKGYEGTTLESSCGTWMYALTDDGYEFRSTAGAGEQLAIVTGESPFYGEAGGQVGDRGSIRGENDAVFHVNNTQKVGDVVFHIGAVESGEFLATGDGEQQLSFEVDRERRARIMANHTSTHMLNRALRRHVNDQADQKGSLVDDEKLRFDFSNDVALTPDQIAAVEKSVNDDIAADHPVYSGDAPLDQAREIQGLRAVFGEKYPPRVRIVSIGVPVEDLLADPLSGQGADYSVEFCGGTHLSKTGNAQGFVIVSEEAIGRGVRRVTALTSGTAHEASAQGELLLHRLEGLRKAIPANLADEVQGVAKTLETVTIPLLARQQLRQGITDLQSHMKVQEKQRSREAEGDVTVAARALADSSEGNLIVARIDGADGKTLRSAMDVIRKKCPEAAMLLAASNDEKVSFLAAVPPLLVERGLKAGDWVRIVAQVAGGGGGGRPDMAQAGGKDPAKTEEALEKGREYARTLID